MTVQLDKIPSIDFPELKLNEHETTEMPFRYVTDATGKPIMPEVSDIPYFENSFRGSIRKSLTPVQGMIDLINADADKAFDGLDFVDEVDGMGNLTVDKP